MATLTTAENLQLINCRLNAIESVLCEILPGLFDEYEELVNKGATLNATQKTALAEYKSKYRGKK